MVKTYKLAANQVRFKVSDISLDLCESETVEFDYNLPTLHPRVKEAIDNGILVETFGSYNADKPFGSPIWRDDFTTTSLNSAWLKINNATPNAVVGQSFAQLKGDVSTSARVCGYVRTIPTGTWTLVAKFAHKRLAENNDSNTNNLIGLGLFNFGSAPPSNSAIDARILYVRGETRTTADVQDLSDLNDVTYVNYIGTYQFREPDYSARFQYLKIVKTATAIKFFASDDGIYWRFVSDGGSEANILPLSPFNYFGMLVSNQTDSFDVGLFDWIGCYTGEIDIIG
jgi:hypothetical protein